MAANKNNESLSRRYLLGKLSEEDGRRLEEDYLADDDAFEEMEVAEDEIIDAYVRNELSRNDRQQFKKLLVTAPRLAKRVEVAKILVARASQQHPQQTEQVVGRPVDPIRRADSWSWNSVFWPNSVFGRLVFTSLALVFVIGVAALFVDWLSLREASRRLSASRAELEQQNQKLIAEQAQRTAETQRLYAELEKQETENSKLNVEIEQALSRPSQPRRIPILLFASGSRGSDSSDRDIKLPREPAIFEFTIMLEEVQYERYLVTVTTADERRISGPHELRPRGKTLKLRLPWTRFSADDYIVSVSGVTSSGSPTEIEDYTFRIIN